MGTLLYNDCVAKIDLTCGWQLSSLSCVNTGEDNQFDAKSWFSSG
jgi:hypothetical protein